MNIKHLLPVSGGSKHIYCWTIKMKMYKLYKCTYVRLVVFIHESWTMILWITSHLKSHEFSSSSWNFYGGSAGYEKDRWYLFLVKWTPVKPRLCWNFSIRMRREWELSKGMVFKYKWRKSWLTQYQYKNKSERSSSFSSKSFGYGYVRKSILVYPRGSSILSAHSWSTWWDGWDEAVEQCLWWRVAQEGDTSVCLYSELCGCWCWNAEA